jgi:uncharacterized protein YbaP (TraB family)
MTKMNPLMLRRCVLCAVLPLLFTMQALRLGAQEKPIDNALLWKVTGKSLLKPSFLFGTIHLQDQRVFNFNDSLYSFIKAADGFAMEIHPDSVVAALMQKADDEASDKLLKQQLTKEEFNQLSRKLRKELGIDANKLTLKEAYLLKDHLSKPEPRADDMPTFVDAYLFGMARNQGKEIVGLEKASDQVNMLDDIKGDFNVRELLRNMKKDRSLTEKLVQLYIREDLQAIHNLMSYMPEEVEDKLLNMRNQVMVQKMDSLIQSKSFVVAVGTAHLPGKKGIIELLREKGYTVEPVFTTSRTHANNYAIKAEQKYVWVDVNEPTLGYSIKMPGKPSPMDMLGGSMKMNMYMDLASMKVYYAAFVVPNLNVSKQNADSVLQAMCKNAMASSKGEAISKSRFTKDKFEGIDFVYKQVTDKMFARVQALAMGKRVYLVGFGSPRQEDLSSKEANDFFKGFTVLDMQANAWETQTFPDYYFSIALPAKGKVVPLTVADSSIRSVQINSLDNTKGAYFGLTVVTANPGYMIPDDSGYFSAGVERLRSNMLMFDLTEKDTTYNGFNAKFIKARLKEDLRLTCLMINRGNRVYNLTAITNAEDSASADIPAFFKSFSFTDYPKLKWQQKKENDYGFTVPVMNQYTKVHFLDEYEDSAKTDREYQWVTYDSASATSFFITRRLISPYLWVKHDSILLKKYMEDLTGKEETLTSYRFVRNGNSSGIEFNIKKPNSSLGQRIRVLLNGPAVYTLQTDVPYQYWKEGYARFVEDFRFAKEEKSSFLFTNSLQRLLKDLTSTDSATHSEAYNAIGSVIYDSADVPALLKAASMEYALDSLHYYPTADKLLDALAEIKHEKIIDVIAAHYNSMKPEQEQFKFGVLNALARKQTEKSYSLIEKLLKQGIPSKGDPDDFVRNLGDSLELTKKLYPYLISLTADTVMGPQLFFVHSKMVDSNLVKIDEFKPYEAALVSAARQLYKKAAADKESYYYALGSYHFLLLMKALNTDSSKAILRKFLGARQTNLKYQAAIALLKLNQPVDAATLLAIATDKDFRIELYAELKVLKQEKLFPAKYANQKAFAESYAASAANDDMDAKLTFVGERTMQYKGKKYKFYLYKAVYEYEDEKPTAFLCIGGVFSLDGKKIEIEDDISGVYWDEEFSSSAIDKQLKKYIASMEEESTEEPPPIEKFEE